MTSTNLLNKLVRAWHEDLDDRGRELLISGGLERSSAIAIYRLSALSQSIGATENRPWDLEQ